MPFLSVGSIDDLFRSAQCDWGVDEQRNPGLHQIQVDLGRSFFLGTEEEAQFHLNLWRTQALPEYYLQGNMSAGNLFLVLGTEHPFLKNVEAIEEWKKQYVRLSFAFVNTRKELCGLVFFFRKDNPAEWFIGLVRNTNALPEHRRVIILSSFDLAPSLPKLKDITITEESVAVFVHEIAHPLIEQLVARMFIARLSIEIDARSLRIKQLLRTLNPEGKAIIDPVSLQDVDVASLFADNRALDLVAHHDLVLPSVLLFDCMSKPNGLRSTLEELEIVQDFQNDRELVRASIALYHAGVLPQCLFIFEDKELLRTIGKLMDQKEFQDSFGALIKAKYSMASLKALCSHEAYYSAIPILIEYGLAESELMNLFNDTKKRDALHYILKVKENDCKKLCLIFWVKGQLTQEEYAAVVQAVREDPELAQVLLAVDKTGEYSIDQLKNQVLNPVARQVQIIKYHFISFFTEHHIDKQALSGLDCFTSEEELKSIVVGLKVLQDIKNPTVLDLCLRLLNENDKNTLVRLFIAQLAAIDNAEERHRLFDMLYLIIIKGPMSQNTALKGGGYDSSLYSLAKDMQERYLCAQQIQALGFNDKVIAFVAGGGAQAARFRQIIQKIEAEGEIMSERVGASSAINRREIIQEWKHAYDAYRLTLFSIAYESLTSSVRVDSLALKQEIKTAEASILSVVDPTIHSLLYLSLVIIANILITALTLGFANSYKEKRTGNYWFFNKTRTGEEIRALNNEVMEMICHDNLEIVVNA